MEESELGLSLRLHSHANEGREEKAKEKEIAGIDSSPKKQSRTEIAGFTSHAVSAPNRKARVSVRARCQAATVSFSLNK